ncbi:hypothetical protein ACXHXG_14710 [Rhizobium sp. LEGMi198b]|uniref:hypothetical protein n=1 Tax=unclassified Rhizobium TaxID=2613769 RepID=UPI0021A36B4E|nr:MULTISPECIES: hypothetical protein [Rhizobium]MDK4742931.1 hypothetical protein [Rhizobium sp. CNPSo 3464]UWU24311.1 hypothetical protein N2601_29315 [Rhizobium tropici]
MTTQDNTALELLRRRTECVAAVSSLTAKALKLAQALSGIEMDILRLELAASRSGNSEKLVRELLDTKNNADEMREAQVSCMEEIAEAEAEVALLDRLIAAARGG